MAKKNVTKTSNSRVSSIEVYYDYDLTGGCPPFGHVRVFHVELNIDRGKTIVRNGSAGKRLKKLVEELGQKIGKKDFLPRDKDYSNRSYRQQFVFPASFTMRYVEEKIPFETIL